ncbi:hypothetical protein [Labedaea rhizosphaerae]|uniref:Uncharacterized protein n=1 Tax=Labedaea rhizosphaerae TaxID=598644 RepID=A0A4V3D085_LABRH|nr:hypothetical protein [Labedaea rhizosphaerae]TDQ04805.1 hypothetical protein EV186_101763 [Labedaea rhizosphaerae]
MAKNAIPGFKTGGGVLSKVVGTAVVLAVLVIVVKHPSDAADFVKTVFGWIDQIATFLREL